MKAVSSAQMGEIDRQAKADYFMPQVILMENAGIKAYRILKDRIWQGLFPEGEVLFLAGKGNNGGDALVMARQCFLEGKRECSVILADGPPKSGTAPEVNLKMCSALGLEIIDFGSDRKQACRRITGAACLVDGLLGTGLAGQVREPVKELIVRINKAGGLKIAIDIPSGIGDTYRKEYVSVRADFTLTVGLPKICLYLPLARRSCGEIIIVKEVFPPDLVDPPDALGEMLEPDNLPELIPKLPSDTYKTKRGHLAVFAGSVGTTGAAWLAATSAARSRTGLVTLFVDQDLYGASVPKFSSVMLRPAPPGPEDFDPASFSAFLIGPGWGVSESRRKRLKYLLSLDLPGVIDADGLNNLGELRGDKLDLGGRWVLTPHPGEFCRLTGDEVEEVLADPLPKLTRLSSEFNAVVILKGHVTFIATPAGSNWILDGMNPALATGGSGDVLAGMIAGLLAGGLSPADAARLGVLAHSQIAWTAWREKGFFLAEDLIPYISLEFKGRG